MTKFLIFLLTGGSLIAGLSSCALMAVGSAAGVGGAIASDQRKLATIYSDEASKLKLQVTYASPASCNEECNIYVEVYKGTAVLAGQVPNWKIRNWAEEEAGSVNGILKVKNYLEVGPVEDLDQRSQDFELSLSTESALLGASGIIKALVVDGIVYLLGSPLNQNQGLKISEGIATLKGVKQVVTIFD